MNNIRKNDFGYYEVVEKPTSEELEQYYIHKYYQNVSGPYSKTYTDEEILYFEIKLTQRYKIITDLLYRKSNQKLRFLDVGCGEGLALKFFKEKGWDIVGFDFSDEGIKGHNPQLADHFLQGDMYEILDQLIGKNERFSCIQLDNILEHVLDPKEILLKCKRLIDKNGVLVIEVPNDFSSVQETLLHNKDISKPFWIAIPDHLSYFNKDGLISLLTVAGWDCADLISDFPIDWCLFNPNTNYVEDPMKGKSCHRQRIEIENLLHSISLDKTNNLYRVLGDMSLGRNIVGFFHLCDDK